MLRGFAPGDPPLLPLQTYNPGPKDTPFTRLYCGHCFHRGCPDPSLFGLGACQASSLVITFENSRKHGDVSAVRFRLGHLKQEVRTTSKPGWMPFFESDLQATEHNIFNPFQPLQSQTILNPIPPSKSSQFAYIRLQPYRTFKRLSLEKASFLSPRILGKMRPWRLEGRRPQWRLLRCT